MLCLRAKRQTSATLQRTTRKSIRFSQVSRYAKCPNRNPWAMIFTRASITKNKVRAKSALSSMVIELLPLLYLASIGSFTVRTTMFRTMKKRHKKFQQMLSCSAMHIRRTLHRKPKMNSDLSWNLPSVFFFKTRTRFRYEVSRLIGLGHIGPMKSERCWASNIMLLRGLSTAT
jgi:hypothetical protein